MDLDSAVSRDSHYWAGARHIEASLPPRPVDPVDASCLATLILEWVAWGLICFPMIPHIASAAQDDGLDRQDIDRLASLGCVHLEPSKMRRDVLAQMRARGLPEPSKI